MRTTLWIFGDQLAPVHPYLEKNQDKHNLQILMIESAAQMQRLPYHPKKLVLLCSAMRHRAEALRKDGFSVDYRQAEDMSSAIEIHSKTTPPDQIVTMAASSFRGREFQQGLSDWLGFPVKVLPNTQFLSSQFDPNPVIRPDEKIRQESFYRAMRRHFGILMAANGEPEGGQWNYDKQNRKPLPAEEIPPEPISFQPDALTQEVMDEIKTLDPSFGTLAGFDLAVTSADAQRAADDFFEHRLVHFGTYEDAMSREHAVLYHSKLSPYLNLGLLDPLDLARRAEAAYRAGRVTLNNAEGFIRQVIGWREYMFWQYQRLMPDLADGNTFRADRPLPAFFWTGDTEMNCLRHVLARLMRDGYVHHIERLMLLSNFCTLAGILPQAVLDWFQSAFIDAYHWVMVPNVNGMGLFADGGRIGTKPYIASANYINKMGDYCSECRYRHTQRTGKDACPFNFLYWGFLLQHEEHLRKNPRMARMLYNLKYLDVEERAAVRRDVARFL